MSNADRAARGKGHGARAGAEPSPSASRSKRFERRLHRGAYHTVQLLRGRPVGVLMRRLCGWDALDAASYARLTRERLEDMLAYASRSVPLYRSPPWSNTLAGNETHIERWPLLERSAIISRRESLIASSSMRLPLYIRRSSASTGTPIRVGWNRLAVAWSWAAEYHPMLWHGLELGARTLRMWGSAHAIENWVLNRHFLPAHDLTPARLTDAVRYLETQQPDLVWGTPSSVHELARHIARTRQPAERPSVRYVKVGGEQLYPFQREEITEQLGARVVESYGCTEVGPMAAECPAGSMHILATNVHLEIFENGEPAPVGTFGDIVATTLVNRGMPFVRCKIGDRGRISPEPCSCGRPQPVLEELQGRAADLLLKTDGTPVHGSILGKALHRYDAGTALGSAQKILFEQLDRRTWTVKVETRQQDDVAALDRQVAELMRETFGDGCRAETQIVDKIPREASGKYRYYKAPRPEERTSANATPHG